MAFSLEDAYDNFKTGAGDALSSAGGSMLSWGKSPAGAKTLLSLGLSAAFNDQLAPNQAKVGYQGSIPDYTMVRERVNPAESRNLPRNLEGRLGLGGAKARRFFSDAKYIKDADKASGREKNAAVLGTDPETYTKDTLGDQYRDLLAGNKVFTAAEQAANPSEYGYTEDGRRIFIPDEKAAFLGQRDRVVGGSQVLGDVYQVPQVEDTNPDSPTFGEMVDISSYALDTYGSTLYDTPENELVYVDNASGREITDNYAFQNPNLIYGRPRDTLTYDDEGYATFSPNEGAIFNDEGYLITELGTQQEDKSYDDTGRVLESEAEYFTNLEAATQDARAQANTLGGVSGQAGLAMGGEVMGYANGGGIGSKLNKVTRGRNPSMDGIGYLNGPTDGMADEVPATIEGNQPAALSDGEFVITADVVSHLGNGNSEAGAKILEDFMQGIRRKRTGTGEQGKEINARREVAGLEGMPTRMAATGGQIKKFAVGGEVANTTAGVDSTFSPIMGDYLTDMLGKAGAVGDKPYDAYDGYGATYKDVTDPDTGETTSELDEAGILTAGSSALQDKAFTSAGDIDTRGFGELSNEDLMGATTGGTDQYGNPITEGGLMNPYIQGSLNPQLRAAQEEAARQEAEQNIRMTQSGSFGGSRNAIMSGMLARDSAQNQADIVAKGYNTAYENARNQFGEDRQFGLDAIQKQADLGQTQQDILQTNIDADRGAFEDERDYEAKIPQYLSDMLQYLPVASTAQQSGSDSDLAQILAGSGGINTLLGGGQQVPAGYTMGTDPTTGEPTLVKKLT